MDGLVRVLDEADARGPARPSPELLVAYERIEAEVCRRLTGTRTYPFGDQVQIGHDATDIAVTLGTNLVRIDAPYDAVDDEAEELVGILQELAWVVESATGWTAYDPQADAPFLGDADGTAAARISAETRRIG